MAKLIMAVFGAALLLGAAPAGQAQDRTALPPLLEQALSKVEAINSQHAHTKFYFRHKLVRFGKLLREKSYNPGEPPDRQWAITYPDYKTDPEGWAKLARKQAKKNAKHAKTQGYDPNRDLMLRDLRPRLARGVKLLHEDENEAVYGFDIADRYYVSGEGKGADIAKYMTGQIGVGKKDHLVHWVHYVAQRPFHPIVIAKIKQFDIYEKYAPAWYGGPIVRVQEKNKVAGTAIIRKIKFDDVVTNYDFRPIAVPTPVASE